MSDVDHFVVFTLDDRQFALRLDIVERITRAVEITPLPQAPPIVLGVVNVQGRILPVIDMRQRFNLKKKQINIEDHFIIGRTSKRNVAILVDTVVDIIESGKEEVIEQDSILPNIDYFEGVVKQTGKMLLIHDLDKVLLLEEEKKLEKAIKAFDQVPDQKNMPKKVKKP